MSFSANASNINVEKGTANLEGVVPDGTNLVQVKWGSTTKAFEPTTEGTFQYTLDKLDLGSNPVEITALANGDELGKFELDVDLHVEDVTAKETFDTEDVQQTVQLEGTGTPGTKVEIRRGMRTIGTAPVDGNGHWAGTVNPPNMTGVDTLDVVQVVRGQDNGSIELPVDYGEGTTITSPNEDFDLSPGSTLVMRGKSQPNSLVRIFEKGKPETILGSAKASSNDGGWAIPIDGLEDREYKLVVATTSKGYNVTTTERTINPGKSAVEQPTAAVQFDVDVTKKAVVSGTGADGATITVKNGANTLGTTTVKDGKWSLPIDPIGPGKHTLTVEQSGIDGTQTITAEADYGDAVAITSPSTGKVVPGDATVTGTGVPDAQITVTAGTKQATTTVGADGRYSATVEIAPSNDVVDVTVSQHSKGNLTTNAVVKVTANGQQQDRPDVAFTTPADGTYTPMKSTTVGGTATPYASVKVTNQWGIIVGQTKADKNGAWSFTRVYGPSAEYTLTATQTRIDGTTQTTGGFRLAPLGAFRSLKVTTENPSTYTPGADFTIRGTATPGATITALNQWGGKAFEVRADQTDGTWSATRVYGPSSEYTLTMIQTALDGTKDQVEGFVLKPAISAVDMTVTSDRDGDTYRPGKHRFSGTGTVGATVTAKNQWGTLMGSATVQPDGTWAFDRNIGPSANYTITFTQTRDGAAVNTVELDLVAPTFQPLTLIKPTTGQGYRPGVVEEWAGTASPFATITVTTKFGNLIKEVEADKDGNWTFKRQFGPTNEYVLTVSQKPLNGPVEDLPAFTYGPAATK